MRSGPLQSDKGGVSAGADRRRERPGSAWASCSRCAGGGSASREACSSEGPGAGYSGFFSSAFPCSFSAPAAGPSAAGVKTRLAAKPSARARDNGEGGGSDPEGRWSLGVAWDEERRGDYAPRRRLRHPCPIRRARRQRSSPQGRCRPTGRGSGGPNRRGRGRGRPR